MPILVNANQYNNSGVVVDSDGKFKRQGDKFPQLSLKRGTFKAHNTPLYPYYVDRIQGGGGFASVLKMQLCHEISTNKNKWGGAGQKHRLHLFPRPSTPRSELFGVNIIEEKRYLFVSDVHLCLLCYIAILQYCIIPRTIPI